MDVAACFRVEKLPRNKRLLDALKTGVEIHGDKIVHYNSPEKKCSPTEDVRIIIGNRDKKQCVDGIHRFVFDKENNCPLGNGVIGPFDICQIGQNPDF
jgi:hypothetical protein